MAQEDPLSHPQENALTLIGAHTPLDPEERADCERMARFIRSHRNCYGKSNALGHITGSAFVLDPAGRVLLTFHAKLQRWLQLGGHSDETETSPTQTALREAQEESGLGDLVFHPVFGSRPIDIDIHTIPARRHEPAHEHLDFRFVFLTETPEAIVLSAESTGLQWWPIDPLPDLGFDDALKRALRKVNAGLNLGSEDP